YGEECSTVFPRDSEVRPGDLNYLLSQLVCHGVARGDADRAAGANIIAGIGLSWFFEATFHCYAGPEVQGREQSVLAPVLESFLRELTPEIARQRLAALLLGMPIFVFGDGVSIPTRYFKQNRLFGVLFTTALRLLFRTRGTKSYALT